MTRSASQSNPTKVPVAKSRSGKSPVAARGANGTAPTETRDKAALARARAAKRAGRGKKTNRAGPQGGGSTFLRALLFALPLILVVYTAVGVALWQGRHAAMALAQAGVTAVPGAHLAQMLGFSEGLSQDPFRLWAILLLGLSVIASGVIFAGAWQVAKPRPRMPLGGMGRGGRTGPPAQANGGAEAGQTLVPGQEEGVTDPLETILPSLSLDGDDGGEEAQNQEIQLLSDRQLDQSRAALGAAEGALSTLIHRHGGAMKAVLEGAEGTTIGSLLSQAQDGAGRSSSGMEDLADMFRIRACPVGPREEPSDADRCLENALERLMPVIHDSDADIRVETLPRTPMNPVLLEILFRRLIGRALTGGASAGGAPRIMVTAEMDGFLPATLIVRDESDGLDGALPADLRADLETPTSEDITPGAPARRRDMDLVVAGLAARRMGCWISVVSYPPAGLEFRLDLPGDPNGGTEPDVGPDGPDGLDGSDGSPV